MAFTCCVCTHQGTTNRGRCNLFYCPPGSVQGVWNPATGTVGVRHVCAEHHRADFGFGGYFNFSRGLPGMA